MYKKKKGNIPARSRYALTVAAAAVIVYLAISAGVGLYEKQPVTQVKRPGSGQEAREEHLYVESEKKRFPLTLDVPARQKSREETEELLKRAYEELSEGLKGENRDLSQVTKPLVMPASAQNGAVAVSWSSDKPEYLSYDGTLGEDIPAAGVQIRLEASLTCQEEVAVYSWPVTVCRQEETGPEAQIRAAAEALNQEQTGETYALPGEYARGKLVWYRRTDNPAMLAAVLVLTTGWLLLQRKEEQKKTKEKRYRTRLLQQYPAFVSQLVLYMGAGMSMGQSLRLLATGKTGQSNGVLEAECQIFARETAQGIPENEAVIRLGERSGLWEYRALCSLLVQNQSRGNAWLLPMLQEEANKAFAERQRRARILGNEAGTRLLMPMLLLLLVVLLIVLFPAITSFYT